MNNKELFVKFIIYYIVAFVMWPAMNWLWTFIDGSDFVFHFGRNCWIATGFALMFAVIIPMFTGGRNRGE